ncbi:hypothetical protein FR943_06730 [Mycobacterium sp. TNTM28]|uniref:PH domain-containing protein n=1 Tax=[Mycobacterium] fortunisiensis TaxID=2600579 RepID=A0ABS6KJS6_9MYCO|nr:hypothetical protein [[Mycobacterium] fortunisiensis]
MPNRWGRRLRYAFAVVLLMMALIGFKEGLQWYWAVIGACAAAGFATLGRQIFRPGVSRTTNEIVCRYIPYYEGNAFFLTILLPLIAIAAIAAGYAPGNPVWLRVAGIALLALTPLFVYSTVRMWRRCLLRISQSALTVRLAVPGDGEITEIRREHVQSIAPKTSPNGVSGTRALQVELAYRPGGSSEVTKTVMLGPQFTVEPINLLNALVAWKDGGKDSTELLDRIEQFLRSRRPTVGV